MTFSTGVTISIVGYRAPQILPRDALIPLPPVRSTWEKIWSMLKIKKYSISQHFIKEMQMSLRIHGLFCQVKSVTFESEENQFKINPTNNIK